MALTDTAIKNARSKTKPYKLADEKGLHLLVQPSGGRLWRMKYRADGSDGHGRPKRVEKLLSFGNYPDVTLKGARAQRDEARKKLAEGLDPGLVRKEAKIASALGAANSFAAVAEEYIRRMEQEGRAEATMNKVQWLSALLTPAIGSRRVAEVTPHELLAALKKVEQAGKRETASRMRSFASRVFRYAVATARASNDPAHMLLGALVPPKVRHHPAITDPRRRWVNCCGPLTDTKGNRRLSLPFALHRTYFSDPAKSDRWNGRKLISKEPCGPPLPSG